MNHKYAFGQKVICDGDKSNAMTVIAIEYRPTSEAFECAYWLNGDHKTVWLPAWRLSEAPVD